MRFGFYLLHIRKHENIELSLKKIFKNSIFEPYLNYIWNSEIATKALSILKFLAFNWLVWFAGCGHFDHG